MIVDVPVPQILEEIVVVERLLSKKRQRLWTAEPPVEIIACFEKDGGGGASAHRVELIVDVSVPQVVVESF